MIKCTVEGARQYSRDLPQGGLEIPCTLTFTASDQPTIDKLSVLIKGIKALTSKVNTEDSNKHKIDQESDSVPLLKVIKLADDDTIQCIEDANEETWVFIEGHVLGRCEKRYCPFKEKVK